MPAENATERFSSRVEDYIRYRPRYPNTLVESLRDEFALRPEHVIADIGAGTGISTEIFLRNGHEVYAVEPNAPMREAAGRLLSRYGRFHNVDGRAEATTLPDRSVDWIIAGQAFHWFDVDAAAREFSRVLRLPPNSNTSHVALFWNNRREDTLFLAAFEEFLRAFATDYEQVKHQNIESDGRLDRFFAQRPAFRRFDNEQVFDLDGVCGRTLSSSYMPGRDHPRYAAMMMALDALFQRHAENGKVRFLYHTHLYVGSVRPAALRV
ncbi:MAG: class I SAM-dependent methyltransferase [Phycisphaerae bacterium]